jgi:hypothetical protein
MSRRGVTAMCDVMSRRGVTAKTSYPCLLLASDTQQQKKTVDSHASGLSSDEKEKSLQVGAPLWAGIWLFWTHVFMGAFMSASCHVYISYIGDTPVWIRAVILLNSTLSGVCDHLGVYMLHPSKLEPVSKVYIPIGLAALIFYFVNVCTVLPASQSTTVVLLNVVAIAGPMIAYKKITGKDPPANYNDALNSYSTLAGLAAHLATDTGLCILSVMSWMLMGRPSFLG